MVHKHIMPLWHAIWAAPGKDTRFNPVSLSERILRFSSFSRKDIDGQLATYLLPVDFREMISDVRQAIDEAPGVFQALRGSLPGNLFVGPNDEIVNDLDAVLSGLKDGSVRSIGPDFGGSLPSSPSIDHALIERVIAEYGPEGSNLLRM